MAHVPTPPGIVHVTAPARLHIGFVDPNGPSGPGRGRRFGSLGLAIDRPAVRLALRRADAAAPGHTACGPEAERARRYLESAARLSGVSGRYAVEVAESVPAHAGFGSGTQLALAVAAAVARLEGVPFDARSFADRLDRGVRSGIGIAAFETGGFVVDGGKGASDAAPPIVARLAFPAPWRLLLVLDAGVAGVHGAAEAEAFRRLPPLPEADIDRHCRLVLTEMLPALAEADIAGFGAAVGELQRRLGSHFAPAQGGGRYTSPRVGRIMAALEAGGAAGVGQSSWGPTGFALYATEADARAGLARLPSADREGDGLSFLIVAGRNRGADVVAAPG